MNDSARLPPDQALRPGQPPAVGPIVFATHPVPRVQQVCARLRERGIRAWPLPAFAIEPADMAGLAAAVARLADYDWAVLVSPTAARLFAEALSASGPPAGCRIALIGQGSLDALAGPCRALCERALVPSHGRDARALLAEPALQQVGGHRVLLVRGEQGRDELAGTLRARGARVDEVRAYRRGPAGWPAASVEALDAAAREGAAALFVVSVSDAADTTRQALQARSPAHWAWARSQPVLAVHPRIARHCDALGWLDVRVVGPGADALAAAIESG